MKLVNIIMYYSYSLVFLFSTATALCPNWDNPEVVGNLNPELINEASGLALSQQYSDRLYHINDSGDGPFFYQTKIDGSVTKKITIAGFNPKDVEDLAYGPCYQGDRCLVIADIGDNRKERTTLELVIVKEEEDFGESIEPKAKIVVKYPHAPIDAESLAMHPNGDIYLLGKNTDYHNRRVNPATLYRLSKEKWENYVPATILEFTKVGEIELAYLAYDFGLFGRMATAFDIAKDGKTILILTYENAIEIKADLAVNGLKPTRDMVEKVDYQLIRLPSLPQQEAVVYLSDGSGFLYDTEYHSPNPASIMKVSCKPEIDTP